MKNRYLYLAAGLSGALAFAMMARVEAKPDVVSAASLTVGASNVTTTTVVINYSKDKYDYGTRTLCYDPAPTTPKSNCVTKTASGNQGTFNVTGLKASTAYNYSIKAVDTKGGEKPYTSTGSFTTLGATGIALRPGEVLPQAIPGLGVDASGRSLNRVRGNQAVRTVFPSR